ncbi:hypothetical protein BDZ94DRAFT_1193384 [Collybia nuda]|uniref:Uncharacterized protein n=1 Tax=Collybia nuda TaxID=64659 RepID=A0A9P6CEN6_9AGAR|nr:hypothetical protein BDZ94DRAFT_1193384 [Collybia nuda]
MGGVRSDHWHRGKQLQAVSRNYSSYPSIHFFPADGVGSGVALTECEYTEGIAMAGRSAKESLPREFQEIESGFLIITWPGYQHLKWKQKLTFVQSNGLPYTVGHMASQVAYLWRNFYQKHYADFRDEGLRLSPTNISFNHLRLHQLFSYDGRTWQAEVSYVCPP